ncbi:MAG: hypothetical protein ABSD08_00875 [Xanthobacteraceae bacterium]|jgi:ABC-type sugar transport system substrate-binding protein
MYEFSKRLLLGLAAVFAVIVTIADASAAGTDGKRIALFMGPTQDKYIGALSKSIEEGKLTSAQAKNYFEGKKIEKAVYLPSKVVTKANLAEVEQPCSY